MYVNINVFVCLHAWQDLLKGDYIYFLFVFLTIFALFGIKHTQTHTHKGCLVFGVALIGLHNLHCTVH